MLLQRGQASDDNCGFGYQSLYYHTKNVSNYVGENAAYGNYSGISITTGFRNTFIGTSAGNSGSQKVDAAGSIAIGNVAYTTKDYQCVLGPSTITETLLRGNVIFGASSTSYASVNVPHGSAPTSPVNGDIWTTTAGLFVRINGVTKTVTLT